MKKHLLQPSPRLRLAGFALCALLFAVLPQAAHAAWGIVDSLNLAPFVPLVLDALMTVATGTYEFFVGRGDGIIYVLIWGILGVSMGLGLIKMYFPQTWLKFFGFQGGGELWEGKIKGMDMATNLLKPAIRAIIAATVLLQIKPIYVTDWIVDPFLRFGAIYTESITDSINQDGIKAKPIECPPDVVAKGWISADSCNFLIQPVANLSHSNNQIIKRGFEFIERGIVGLMTFLPRGGEGFLNLITGILLVFTFVASNIFMALLIIQGIFFFGMSLILYPFQVLVWVAKPKTDKWLDFWPAFDGIIDALRKLIITMIASAFILAVNIAVIRALFGWNSSVFVNGAAVGENALGFGQHSILWLSTILTFYLMFEIFRLTRDQLEKYAGKEMLGLNDTLKKDTTTTLKNLSDLAKKTGAAIGWTKKKS